MIQATRYRGCRHHRFRRRVSVFQKHRSSHLSIEGWESGVTHTIPDAGSRSLILIPFVKQLRGRFTRFDDMFLCMWSRSNLYRVVLLTVRWRRAWPSTHVRSLILVWLGFVRGDNRTGTGRWALRDPVYTPHKALVGIAGPFPGRARGVVSCVPSRSGHTTTRRIA